MPAPSTRQRLAGCLLVFATAWLIPLASNADEPVRPDLSSAGDPPAAARAATSSERTDANKDEGSSATATAATEVPTLEGPLLPEVFGPSLKPVDSQAPPRLQVPANPKPRGLLPLFVTYGVLQALDVHSTLTAVNRGANEQNAVMAPFVNRPAAFIAFKAGVSAVTLIAADRLAKHNRFASYALMIGLNSAYAVIVAHNYRVAQQAR